MPIELRYRTFFAYLDVPKDVRRSIGRRVFRRTLQTDSRSVAERRAALLIAQWKSEISKAREEPNHNDALFWRDQLRRAKTPEDRLIIEHNLETHVLMQGLDNTDPEAQRFYDQAFGTLIPTSEYLGEWLLSLQVEVRTAKMRRSTIERLAAKFTHLRDISRKEVRRWATELMVEDERPLKPATVQRMMSDCRTYWKYLETIEVVSEDIAPFDRIGLKVPGGRARIPWLPEELVKLLRAAEEKDQVLADLIKLAMYSGARLGELVNLQVSDIEADHYRITHSKTEAGVRIVPVHPEVSEAMERLVRDSTDGYVLSDISGRHRVDTMSKAFQRLRKSAGYADSRQVFHSIRNTVITMLERAGVPESTVQDIVGHERSTLTGSIYSGKSTLEMRKEALARLAY